MGALHSGHRALIRRGGEIGDEVVVSVYVNPTQFRPGEDYEKYPRTPGQDIALAEDAGASLIFMPSSEEVYPDGPHSMNIHIGEVGDKWEGAQRPGHFDGVATVVAKLFTMVRPSAAIFGRKDLQQCAVVRRLISELFLPVELDIVDTIRELDGLALSSRNVYLSPTERAVAPKLYATLVEVRDTVIGGGAPAIDGAIHRAKTSLGEHFDVDYLAVVNQDTMEPATVLDGLLSIIVAAKIGTTRLIDNLTIREG
jgi:pantoate--beta-alanine ligase